MSQQDRYSANDSRRPSWYGQPQYHGMLVVILLLYKKDILFAFLLDIDNQFKIPKIHCFPFFTDWHKSNADPRFSTFHILGSIITSHDSRNLLSPTESWGHLEFPGDFVGVYDFNVNYDQYFSSYFFLVVTFFITVNFWN